MGRRWPLGSRHTLPLVTKLFFPPLKICYFFLTSWWFLICFIMGCFDYVISGFSLPGWRHSPSPPITTLPPSHVVGFSPNENPRIKTRLALLKGHALLLPPTATNHCNRWFLKCHCSRLTEDYKTVIVPVRVHVNAPVQITELRLLNKCFCSRDCIQSFHNACSNSSHSRFRLCLEMTLRYFGPLLSGGALLSEGPLLSGTTRKVPTLMLLSNSR